MTKHLGLLTRVRRLEKARRAQRPRRSIIIGLYDREDSEVVGIDGVAGPLCDRRWEEPFAALVSRAQGITGPRKLLMARYCHSAPETPLCGDPGAMPEPPPLPTFDRHSPDPVARWRQFEKELNNEGFGQPSGQ